MRVFCHQSTWYWWYWCSRICAILLLWSQICESDAEGWNSSATSLRSLPSRSAARLVNGHYHEYRHHHNHRSKYGVWSNMIAVFYTHGTDLIFVTNITNYIRGEKIVKWRNFSFPCMTIVGKLKISPHMENFSTIDGVLLQFMPFYC